MTPSTEQTNKAGAGVTLWPYLPARCSCGTENNCSSALTTKFDSALASRFLLNLAGGNLRSFYSHCVGILSTPQYSGLRRNVLRSRFPRINNLKPFDQTSHNLSDGLHHNSNSVFLVPLLSVFQRTERVFGIVRKAFGKIQNV